MLQPFGKVHIFKLLTYSERVYMEEIEITTDIDVQGGLNDDDISRWSKEKKEETVDLIKGLIRNALEKLYQNDMHLICNCPVTKCKSTDNKHHVGERSIVFRFAYYLQELLNKEKRLSSYNLDCEYNRNGVKAKRLPGFPNGTYPDVILHRRGSNTSNLLVIEFKTYWNDNQDDDIRKIKSFTDQKGEYKFLLGVTVLIGKDKAKQRLFFESDEITMKGIQKKWQNL